MSPVSARPSAVSSRIARTADALAQAGAVAEADLRKLRHDPWEPVMRMVQPALWLLIFGQVLARTRGIPTGGVSYVAFLAPGILAQSVLFVAIFYGVSLIWERDLGIVNKYLVSPAPRAALVLGRALASGVRGISQAAVVYVLAVWLGVPVRWTVGAVAGVVLMVMLGAAVFSTFSLIVACIVKTRERFMGIGQVLTMPLFFASDAIYPVALMPGWLQGVAACNPLTYQVDALRSLMVGSVPGSSGLALDFAIQVAALALLTGVATRLYPRIVD
jgi:ABC-2 type transport system permease protein